VEAVSQRVVHSRSRGGAPGVWVLDGGIPSSEVGGVAGMGLGRDYSQSLQETAVSASCWFDWASTEGQGSSSSITGKVRRGEVSYHLPYFFGKGFRDQKVILRAGTYGERFEFWDNNVA
jgi:hypothetical protein